jgi:hypothetical protein
VDKSHNASKKFIIDQALVSIFYTSPDPSLVIEMLVGHIAVGYTTINYILTKIPLLPKQLGNIKSAVQGSNGGSCQPMIAARAAYYMLLYIC